MTVEKTYSLPLINQSDIQCKGCGACCMHVGHPMFFKAIGGFKAAESAWIDLPQDLKDEHNAYMLALDGDDYGTPCYWLDSDTRRCGHYENRPQVCREFEPGSTDCLDVLKRTLDEKCARNERTQNLTGENYDDA